MEKEKLAPVIIAQQHVFYIIACANKSASKEEVEKHVNEQIPSGVSSDWQIPDEMPDGKPNPIACEDFPDRLHYYLNC